MSRLYDRAPKDERVKCAVSTVACAAFLGASFVACESNLAHWAIQYLAPYLCFSWWLFTVTYLQHHDYDTKAYDVKASGSTSSVGWRRSTESLGTAWMS